MEEGRDTFYVVRKGNTIGVYKSFSDCQAQVSSSVCDPSVSVYKGSSLTKEAEKHLSSCGLKNAFYTIDSAYVDENLFGNLVPCPFQMSQARKGTPNFRWSTSYSEFAIRYLADLAKEGLKVDKAFKNTAYVRTAAAVNANFKINDVDDKKVISHYKTVKSWWDTIQNAKNLSGNGNYFDKDTYTIGMDADTAREYIAQPEGPSFSTDKASKKTSTLKRPNEVLELDSSSERVGSTSVSTDYSTKQLKVFKSTEAQPVLSNHMSCILEFDGASKGNPGKSGAGAVLRTENGQVVARLREGLGVVTNNVAEYRAVILGLKYALMKGFKHIRVQGDSQLVCMQVQDKWQTKNMNMADLCKEVKELKDKFLSFQISHVRREFNSAADAQANLAINLQYGQIHEEPGDLQ